MGVAQHARRQRHLEADKFLQPLVRAGRRCARGRDVDRVVGGRHAVARRLAQHPHRILGTAIRGCPGHPDEVGIGRVIGNQRLGDIGLCQELIIAQPGNRFVEGIAGGRRHEGGVLRRRRLRRCSQRGEVDTHQPVGLVGIVGRAADLGAAATGDAGLRLALGRRREFTLRLVPYAAPEKHVEQPLRACLRRAEGQCRRDRERHDGGFVSEDFHEITRSGCKPAPVPHCWTIPPTAWRM